MRNVKLWNSLHYYSRHLKVYAAPRAAISVLSLSCSSEGEFKVPYYREREGAQGHASPQLELKGTTFRLWQLLITGFELEEKIEGVMCFHDVNSQIPGSACVCQANPLYEMYNWLMGLQKTGWQGKVIGWYDFESSCNWLTSEVQLRSSRL